MNQREDNSERDFQSKRTWNGKMEKGSEERYING